jgi:hypothetical protein
MELIVAPAVKRADRVAIVAPASPVSGDLLEAGIAVLRSWLVSLHNFRCILSVPECEYCKQFSDHGHIALGTRANPFVGLWHQFRKISFSSHLSCSG